MEMEVEMENGNTKSEDGRIAVTGPDGSRAIHAARGWDTDDHYLRLIAAGGINVAAYAPGRWAKVERVAEPEYPRREGDTTVIGPECFADEDGTVICWRGENYYRPLNLPDAGSPNAVYLNAIGTLSAALRDIRDSYDTGTAAHDLAHKALDDIDHIRPQAQPAPELAAAADVHVDWHMTPDEWAQLSGVLASHAGVPYVARLIADGKLPADAKAAAAPEQGDAPDLITRLRDQIAALSADLSDERISRETLRMSRDDAVRDAAGNAAQLAEARAELESVSAERDALKDKFAMTPHQPEPDTGGYCGLCGFEPGNWRHDGEPAPELAAAMAETRQLRAAMHTLADLWDASANRDDAAATRTSRPRQVLSTRAAMYRKCAADIRQLAGPKRSEPPS